MTELEYQELIVNFLNEIVTEEELMNVLNIKRCEICGHCDLEENMHENEDAIYCELCWESKD